MAIQTHVYSRVSWKDKITNDRILEELGVTREVLSEVQKKDSHSPAGKICQQKKKRQTCHHFDK